MPISKSVIKLTESTHGNKSDCNVDDITAKAIGDFGPWQLRISVLMALLKLPMAWYQLNIIFMAPPQDFWCEKPDSLSEYSEEEWRKICIPVGIVFLIAMEMVNQSYAATSRHNRRLLFCVDLHGYMNERSKKYIMITDC